MQIQYDLGEPSSLDKDQLKILRDCAVPYIQTKSLQNEDGKIKVSFDLKANAVVYFEIKAVETCPDRGFDFDRSNY